MSFDLESPELEAYINIFNAIRDIRARLVKTNPESPAIKHLDGLAEEVWKEAREMGMREKPPVS